MFGRFFKSRQNGLTPEASLPPGERVYAIGDIHGRLDLLDDLLDQIEQDDQARGPAEMTLIFLGDLIDRGPDSAGVVERLMAIKRVLPRTRFLLGNHEEVMLLALDANREALRLFDRIGGRATMLSYGLDETAISRSSFSDLLTLMAEHVPPEHVQFMRDFEDMIVVGDYAFVHAGIRPGVAIDAQQQSDLRWIRGEFLDHRGTFDKLIVHGHTITDDVEWCAHRIGIDTGAFATGRLTALGLEGEERWLLQTSGSEDPDPAEN